MVRRSRKTARRTRRPKTQRVPRTRAGNEWTEASFWGFIRSALRDASRKWPPRKRALLNARRRYVGPNKRQKWEYECAGCGRWRMAKEVQVDHVEPCGTLKEYEDLPEFVRRLFCEVGELRVLCLACHKEVTEKELDCASDH